MDEGKTYVNVKFAKTGPQSPSKDGVTSTYSELNFPKEEPLIAESEDLPTASGPGEQRITTQTDGVTSTYTELNVPDQEPLIAESEDRSTAQGPGGQPITAQTIGVTSTYSELSFPKDKPLIVESEDRPTVSGRGEQPITAQTGDVTSTYSELNFPKEVPLIAESEDRPTASGPGEQAVTAQTGAPDQEPKQSIGNRWDRKVCVLCLVTSVLVAIVAGLSIHVSQIRQSQISSDRKYQLLREQYINVLNKNLSLFEKRLKDVEETKGELCQFLTSNREQACSQDWIRNEERCYFISTFKNSYDGAKQYCSESDSKLLEINSKEEQSLVSYAIRELYVAHWIGRCRNGRMDPNTVHMVTFRKFSCNTCKARLLHRHNNDQHYFICEKPVPFCPDIPVKIQDLCEDPVVSTETK